MGESAYASKGTMALNLIQFDMSQAAIQVTVI